MSAAPTFDQLPPEILEAIFAELACDTETFDALCLTCHALCALTRPNRFPTITLHDNNFNDFMKLTYSASWNTILPHTRRLALGTKMFPLSHCHLGGPESELRWNSDLTNWAAHFSRLWTLDLRGAFWSKLPLSLVTALISLDVENLIVCLGERALRVEDLRNVVLPAIRPKALMIAGPPWVRPPWAQKALPPFSQHPIKPTPLNIHYMQLDRTTPIGDLMDWLKSFNAPPSITHLCIALPNDKESTFGLALAEILCLVSPVHLQLKLPPTSQTHFEFPIETFSDLETLQISSISNGVLLSPESTIDEEGKKLTDITVTSRLLNQFSVLQNHLRHVQLDSICAHTDLIFGDIPGVLLTSYPSLESLSLTVRTGKGTHRRNLDAWLIQNPFAKLQTRGIVFGVETVENDPTLALP